MWIPNAAKKHISREYRYRDPVPPERVRERIGGWLEEHFDFSGDMNRKAVIVNLERSEAGVYVTVTEHDYTG